MQVPNAAKTPISIKEVQQIALSILKKIDSVCEKNNFHYSLAFGTLIGAVRHKGFIPWDDDIDIVMPRSDYENLLSFLHKNPIENLDVFYWKYKKNYYYGITRICDMRYHIVEKGRNDCGMGVFIDIYPLDGLENNKKDSIKLLHSMDKYKADVANFIYTKDRALFISRNPLFEIIRNIKRLIRFFKGLQYYQKKYELKARQHSFNAYKYVGVPNWACDYKAYKKEWFQEYIQIEFENNSFFAIKAFDDFLRECYGDYMQLPPKEKRVYQHCYKAYKIK